MMINAHVVANWIAVALWLASAVFWVIAARIKVPVLVGALRDIGPEGTGKLSRQLGTQSCWNAWAAGMSAAGAIAQGIANLTGN